MNSYRDMKAQIAKLEKQAADLFKKEVADAVSKIKALMNDYGLSISDLGLGGKAGRKTSPKKSSAPKYRDPVSGKTWTGHGKAPGWLTSAVQAGKSRDAFLITKPAAAKVASVAAKPAAKTKPKTSPATQAASPAKSKTLAAKPSAKPSAKPAPQKKVVVKTPAAKTAAKPSASKAPAKQASKPAAKPAKAKPAAKTPTAKVVTTPPTAA
jgi:DNA-binding protein H-NS